MYQMETMCLTKGEKVVDIQEKSDKKVIRAKKIEYEVYKFIK